jgi:pilus assembly protein Flp/PilA
MATTQGLVGAGNAAGGRTTYSVPARLALTTLLRKFFGAEDGSTAIEYAMIAAGIALAIISAVNLLGQNVNTLFFSKIVAAF